MENKKNLQWGIILSYVTMFAGLIVSMVYTPFLLRALGSQQYGLYNMGQAAVSYLGLTEFGLGNAIVRYSSKYRAMGDEKKASSMYGMFMYIYAVLSIITLLLGSVVCIGSEHFFTVTSGEVGYKQLKIIIAIMVVNLSVSFLLQPYNAIINSFERFSFLKIMNLIYTILKPIVMIPLLILGYKAVALSIVTMLLTIALHLADVLYIKLVLKIKIDFNTKNMEFGLIREIIGYSGFIFLGSIVSQLNDNADSIILGKISGESAVAVYAIGYQLHTYIRQFPQTISSVFFPRVTVKLTKGASMDDMTDLSIKIGRIQFFFAALLLSGFGIFGKEFVALWAGDEFELAYYIVLILITTSIIPDIQSIPVLVIQAINKHQYKAALYVICAVLNVITSIPAALYFGPIGCAACTGATTILTKGILINIYYWRNIGLDIPRFWKTIIGTLKYIVPLALACYMVNLYVTTSYDFSFLIVKVIVYSFAYVLIVSLLCCNSDEKIMIKSFLCKVRNICKRR